MSHTGTLGRILLIPLVLVLLSGPAYGDFQPQLWRGLLGVADLPAGYNAWKPTYEPYDASSSPACSAVLDELEFSKPRFRGVEYATAGFAKGKFGPWVLETLRRYPSVATADLDLDRVLGVLRNCSTFSHAYRGEKAAVITLKVTPVKMSGVGERSKALWITANTNDSWAYGEVLVLARTRGTVMVLSQLAFTPPDAKTAQAVVNRAAAKMGTVAGR
ncbi:hypothetical protein AB0395_42070 [Streptosporangium sp. NPDC051023]|uniref:hypothetical protein n=1 Tax=Streptosporangium sp. NPDC051023 TaxID=3155410 RepID=UPI003450DDEB